MLIAFHKPFGFLSQFTLPAGSRWNTLAAFGFPPSVYPIGRLDADSEGLLLLSDEPSLNQRLLHPRQGHPREYWVQVEGVPTEAALKALSVSMVIQSQKRRAGHARLLTPQPQIAPRDPPIRFRKHIPDCWIALELTEGKNRQVRRMTAAAGHPTLRLIRVRLGGLLLGNLAPGQWKRLSPAERAALLEY